MERRRERIYVDLDDTLCKFTDASDKAKAKVPGQKFPQAQMDFYRKLEPIRNAVHAMNKLAEHYDVWILSRPSYLNPLCYTEKRLWVEDHLGIDWCERLILCSDKSLLKGDWLIDDVDWPGFEGKQIKFGAIATGRMRQLAGPIFIDWSEILEYLIVERIKNGED